MFCIEWSASTRAASQALKRHDLIANLVTRFVAETGSPATSSGDIRPGQCCLPANVTGLPYVTAWMAWFSAARRHIAAKGDGMSTL